MVDLRFRDIVRFSCGCNMVADFELKKLVKPDVWWRLQTVPIIAMTADAFEEEKKKTLEAGMNYHLSRPINPKTLYNILSNHLTGKEA